MIIIEPNFSGNVISETTNMYAISQNHYDKYFKPIIMINMLTQYAYTDTTPKKWFASKNEIYYVYYVFMMVWNILKQKHWRGTRQRVVSGAHKLQTIVQIDCNTIDLSKKQTIQMFKIWNCGKLCKFCFCFVFVFVL